MPALRRLARLPALHVGVVTAAVYLLQVSLQWRRYATSSYDLGIFTQAVAAYAAGRPPVASIKGAGFDLLGEHFHPVLALLAPAYALLPSPFTLQVAQVTLVAASAAIVTGVVHRALGAPSAYAFGAAYALAWGVQQAVACQFHEVAFAAPLVAAAAGGIVLDRPRTVVLAAAPLVFVKEDLGLTVAALALVLALRTRQGWLSGALAAWGIGWTALAMTVLIPARAATGGYRFAADLSPTPWPDLLGALGQPDKALTLGLLVAASGLVGLRSPLMLACLPTLAWRFVSLNRYHWGPGWHYSLVLAPLAVLAAADAARRLRSAPPGRRGRTARAWARVAPGLVLGAALGILPGQPLYHLLASDAWTAPRADSAQTVLALVPDGAVVASDHALIDRLAVRTQVYFLGVPGPPPQWVLIDVRGGGVPADADVAAYAAGLYPGTWERVADAQGYQLARRE